MHPFANQPIPGLTQFLSVRLFDADEDGYAVWRVRIDEDDRYVEGLVTDDIWRVLERASVAYEEEK